MRYKQMDFDYQKVYDKSNKSCAYFFPKTDLKFEK